MCTFLGTAGKINENDVSSDAIKQSETILLEGYLWDEGEPKKAFEKAIQSAKKVAMSLSDQFCVDHSNPLEFVLSPANIPQRFVRHPLAVGCCDPRTMIRTHALTGRG